ncbi:NYN domain-containing protein [Devosia sp. 919]|uniref:NYN domain-containing protein n=1 Tax=Devosia sp. 919 TaxID=2726065 RepID=UPI001557114A|nr:NYN domain-containing protein [Devosia sp. 919]
MKPKAWRWLTRIVGEPTIIHRIGVFIDCDGVSPKDAERAVELITEYGRICLLRAYGNYTDRTASAWTSFIRRNSADARHLPNLTAGKNATDIALTVDAVEVLLTGPIDLFVLIVSDADFVPLARRIRAEGKMVFGFGQKSTALSLQNACDKFWDLKLLDKHSPSRDLARVFWKKSPRDAEEFLVMVLRELTPQGEPVGLEILRKALVERDPGFDPRVYSRRTLTDLLRELPSVELTEREGSRQVRLSRVCD